MVAADREGGAAGIQRQQTQRLPQLDIDPQGTNTLTECCLHWSVHLPLATKPFTSLSTLYQNRRLPTSPTSFSLATLPDPTSRTTRHTPKAFFLHRGSVRRAGWLDGCCTGHGSLSRRCRNTSQPRLRLTRDTPCILLAGSRKIPRKALRLATASRSMSNRDPKLHDAPARRFSCAPEPFDSRVGELQSSQDGHPELSTSRRS
ncbi:hypothetical protein IWX46DRAFT_610869 [Phyllosticta citricarpa]|uniref:Uncharacterized protein n=1 Tax=Phyllosticta citricarpa TaxID=55181 RepID=A0ABR1LKF7_9PEZI